MKTDLVARLLCPWIALGLGSALLSTPASAIDHSNLDEDRPLRIEDAYPIAHGEIAVESGIGFALDRSSPDRGLFQGQILYGAMPNFHVELGTELSTDPGRVGEPNRSGDVELSGLYNFNQETPGFPAFATKLSVDFPTGVDSAGVDFALKAIATKSLERTRIHVNAGYSLVSGGESGERDGFFAIALGASHPIGAPMNTRFTVVGDFFARQSLSRGEPTFFGVEGGFRYQLTQRWVLDAGLGSELAGSDERSTFYGTAGLSFGF